MSSFAAGKGEPHGGKWTLCLPSKSGLTAESSCLLLPVSIHRQMNSTAKSYATVHITFPNTMISRRDKERR